MAGECRGRRHRARGGSARPLGLARRRSAPCLVTTPTSSPTRSPELAFVPPLDALLGVDGADPMPDGWTSADGERLVPRRRPRREPGRRVPPRALRAVAPAVRPCRRGRPRRALRHPGPDHRRVPSGAGTCPAAPVPRRGGGRHAPGRAFGRAHDRPRRRSGTRVAERRTSRCCCSPIHPSPRTDAAGTEWRSSSPPTSNRRRAMNLDRARLSARVLGDVLDQTGDERVTLLSTAQGLGSRGFEDDSEVATAGGGGARARATPARRRGRGIPRAARRHRGARAPSGGGDPTPPPGAVRAVAGCSDGGADRCRQGRRPRRCRTGTGALHPPRRRHCSRRRPCAPRSRPTRPAVPISGRPSPLLVRPPRQPRRPRSAGADRRSSGETG